MPGANCSIYGCGTCRNQKNYSIFKVPATKDDDEVHNKWRKDLIHVITRDRIVDSHLRKLIAGSRLYICEKHFEPSQIYTCKYKAW